MSDAASLVRRELGRIRGRWEAADKKAYAASVAIAFGASAGAEREAAEAERDDAAGELFGLESDLADLLLLLLRLARRHRPEALADSLSEAMGEELDTFAREIAHARARR